MEIKIYNSLTNKIEVFKTLKENEISMYVCGPTVYNDIHIGNGRPVVFFDVVRRFFEYVGYKVIMVENFTDIDDKIIKKAQEENVSENVISERYINAFLKVCEDAGCKMDIIHPKVTENINEIIDFIEELVKKGYAYVSKDDVYFKINSVSSYGKLSNQKIEELDPGARINVNIMKENPGDFTLWKKTSDNGRKWESPFGSGRPGWHTECVVMINKIFGSLIDIHGGGVDLRFPHHENEIAQSMAINGTTLANYWMHNARIDLLGEKMSKSLGNCIWLKDVLNAYPYQTYRLFILANHYRQTVSYSEEIMNNMNNDWKKIAKTYLSVYRKLELANILKIESAKPELMEKFIKEMAYDFNTANALTEIFNQTKVLNIALRNPNLDPANLLEEFKAFNDMLTIFGLNVDVKPLTENEKNLVIAWQEARKMKNYDLADQLRNQITLAKIEL